MPSISDILDSVQVPTLIKDEVIKGGEFETSRKGLVYYTGGFTVVFPVTKASQKWAFRCWHSELGNVRKRFKTVSEYINKIKSGYFCDFYYCDEGLLVDGKIYPTTRMKWIDGQQLNDYIKANIHSSDVLTSLAENFINLIDFLHEKHIAHGDLQHGNILIENGNLKLVDYDSIFVPGLDGNSDIIVGKADFQHPQRKNLGVTSEKLDYFSELVIYLSILSLAKCPELINEFPIDDSLLFHVQDWQDFENSKIHKSLSDTHDDTISLLLLILKNYLKEDDVNNLKPFTEIWRQMQQAPIIKAFSVGNADGYAFRAEPTTVQWEIENVDRILLNDEAIDVETASLDKVFDSDTDLVLTIFNGLHKIEIKKQIKVIEKPQITFSSNVKKVRREKNKIESAYLSWNVLNFHSVTVKAGNKVLSTKSSQSRYKVDLTNDTTYQIVVVGLDKKTEFSETINISVREPAEIIFQSDKSYTLPNVPITLTWETKNVKRAFLNQNPVPNSGKTVFTPTKDEKYTLLIEDEFGETEKVVEVKMLPLPVIEKLYIPTPIINNNVSVHTNFNLLQPALEPIKGVELADVDIKKFEVQLPENPTIAPYPKCHTLINNFLEISWWRELISKLSNVNNIFKRINKS